MVEAIQFTSAAECIAHAAAMRAKFYGRKAPIMAKPDAEAPPAKPVYIDGEDACEDDEYVEAAVSYNEHVIEFRRWQLENEISESFPRRQTMAEITREVMADHPRLTLRDIQRPGRAQPMLGIRQLAMHEIRVRRPDISLTQIGRFFGGRDHTCVLHALKVVSKRMNGAEA